MDALEDPYQEPEIVELSASVNVFNGHSEWQFSGFAKNLIQLLRGSLARLNEDQIKAFVVAELGPLSTHNEATFLYTQALLKRLAVEPCGDDRMWGYRLRRISYELDDYMSNLEG